jgi:hypothetical protein
MNIAADLRIIETQTLKVVSAVSMQKQLVGYEVDFEVFRFFEFFGSKHLFDAYAGNKSQEPLQLGVRAALEEAVLRMLGDVTRVPVEACLPRDPVSMPGGAQVLSGEDRFVLVGTYADRPNAQAALERLQAAGVPAGLRELPTGNGWQLLAGPVPNAAQRAALERQLSVLPGGRSP